MSKVYIGTSVLEYERERAELHVTIAQATLDAAKSHLAYIEQRNKSLLEQSRVPVEVLVREPAQNVLRLVRTGPNKINVIKAVREFTDLGLKEAKDLVESALPIAVSEGAYIREKGRQDEHVGRYLGAWGDPTSLDYCEGLVSNGAQVRQWCIDSTDKLESFAQKLADAGATIAWAVR